jgi:endonuclease I
MINLTLVDYIPADNGTNEPIHAKLSVLLEWHDIDPVDDFERNRNEVIYSYQENRNPFIDHPEFVASIWDN